MSAVVFLHACRARGSASPTDISSAGLRLRRDLQVALGAMARAKNTASEEDLRKCLKGELDSLDPAKFNADTEDVVEAYCIFIRSLLRLTPRPNVSVLAKAAEKVFLKAEPDMQKMVPVHLQCNPTLSQKTQEYEEWDQAFSSCEVDM